MALFANGAVITFPGTPDDVVAEVTNITGPTVSRDMADATVHGSTDKYRVFIPTLVDGGEITIEGYLSSQADGNILQGRVDSGTKTVDTTLVAGVLTWTFDCYVSNFSTTFPHDGLIGYSATIKMDGKPVLTATP